MPFYFSLFAALLIFSSAAVAAPQFQVNAPQRLKLGEPLIVDVLVDAKMDALTATVSLASGGPPLATKRWQRTQANKRYRVSTPLTSGRHALILRLEGQSSDEKSTIDFPISILVVQSIDVSVSKRGLDATSGRLTLESKSQIATVELEAFDRDGQPFLQQTHDFQTNPKSGRFQVTFPSIPDDKIFRMEIKAIDVAGQWRRFKFVKWFAEIPHEDVIFETAKWSISESEAKKLERDIVKLNDEIRAFRQTVGRADVQFDVTLYIGGMTDTVGSNLANQRLSQKRARAIGQYFRKRGFAMPIRVAGFGESALRVATPDETAEVLNRRAVYILTSGTAPRLTPPVGRWDKL